MPECHGGAKWSDLGPINTLFMLPHAMMTEDLSLNRFGTAPTY
jgi:hypothetical protein